MKLEGRQVILSATDLSKHLACRHLTTLDLREARGEIKRPFRDDPGLKASSTEASVTKPNTSLISAARASPSVSSPLCRR
jgi:hypothetical protein